MKESINKEFEKVNSKFDKINKILEMNYATYNPEYVEELDLTGLYDNTTIFPDFIFKCVNLKKLILGSCIYDATHPFMDELPKEISNLKKLEHLDLGGCKFTKLPNEIGELVNLEYLDLSDNGIDELPESFGNLTELNELDLRKTPLSTYPKSFTQLTKLTKIHYSSFNLAEVPDFIFNNFKDIFEHKLPQEIFSFSDRNDWKDVYLRILQNYVKGNIYWEDYISTTNRIVLTKDFLYWIGLEEDHVNYFYNLWFEGDYIPQVNDYILICTRLMNLVNIRGLVLRLMIDTRGAGSLKFIMDHFPKVKWSGAINRRFHLRSTDDFGESFIFHFGPKGNKLSNYFSLLFKGMPANIECPHCAHCRLHTSMSQCENECGTYFSSFVHRGMCPKCKRQDTKTTCLNCGVTSPHQDWYVEKNIN
jgi:hypothetical protein